MKTCLSYLSVIFLFLCSCSNSENTSLDPLDAILSRDLDIQIEPETNFTLILLDTDRPLLYFEIIKLDTGHATRVHPADSVQVLDSSTYGYTDALQKGELIEEENTWSARTSFVLGTSVGHAGQFEGVGPRYLGFRYSENGELHYGWVLLSNNYGNTDLQIQSYGLNQTPINGIMAGQIE